MVRWKEEVHELIDSEHDGGLSGARAVVVVHVTEVEEEGSAACILWWWSGVVLVVGWSRWRKRVVLLASCG